MKEAGRKKNFCYRLSLFIMHRSLTIKMSMTSGFRPFFVYYTIRKDKS